MHYRVIIIIIIFYRMPPTVPNYSSDEFATDLLFTGNNTTPSEFFSSVVKGLVNATEHVPASKESFTDYNIFWAGKWMFGNSWKIVAAPGLLGNAIIVIVTLKMKPFNSTSLFMLSLALVDLLTICIRIPFKTVPFSSTVICRSMWYLYNGFPLYSNNILLFWTIERFIAVQFPLRVTEWCTLKRTAIAIIAAGVFSFSVNIAWPVSIIGKPSGGGCDLYNDKYEFIYKYWLKVDTSLLIFIPMIIIGLCNIKIIHCLQRSTKRHQQMTSNEESRQKREKEQRNTTITLLSVSFAFLILHTPLAIYNCLALSTTQLTDPEAIATWGFLNFFGHIMMELQNSVNFYLYFLTSRRYRLIMSKLFLPCRTKSAFQGSASTTKIIGVSNSSYIN